MLTRGRLQLGVLALIGVVALGVLATYVLGRQTSQLPLPDVKQPTSARPTPRASPAQDPVTRPSIPDTAEVVAAPAAAPSGARAIIEAPRDGAVVSSPITVTMAVTGLVVAPAGSTDANEGHFHLLIDASLDDLIAPMRRDAQHVDLGDGATETVIDLPPGKHTLQLAMGDGNHVPHSPPILSAPVSITVGLSQPEGGKAARMESQ